MRNLQNGIERRSPSVQTPNNSVFYWVEGAIGSFCLNQRQDAPCMYIIGMLWGFPLLFNVTTLMSILSSDGLMLVNSVCEKFGLIS